MTLALIDLLAIYYQSGNLELMEAITRSMLSAVPNDTVALQFLGLTLHMKGRVDDAHKIFQRFAEVSTVGSSPELTSTSCELAATASYRAATRQGSGLARGWTGIAQIFTRLGYSRHATRARKAALKADEGSAGYSLVEQTGSGRVVVERFISQCFFESFGSRVETFMPRLFSLHSANGEIQGAFGLRPANRRLFLEQYLDLPIDEEIALRTDNKVERGTVVEVGHFSGNFPGAVRAMIGLLTAQLHREGYQWVAFTGTTNLRNAFNRMGLYPMDIHAAEAECLSAEERAAWGRYYDHAPRVLVGNVNEGYQALTNRSTQQGTQFGRRA